MIVAQPSWGPSILQSVALQNLNVISLGNIMEYRQAKVAHAIVAAGFRYGFRQPTCCYKLELFHKLTAVTPESRPSRSVTVFCLWVLSCASVWAGMAAASPLVPASTSSLRLYYHQLQHCAGTNVGFISAAARISVIIKKLLSSPQHQHHLQRKKLGNQIKAPPQRTTQAKVNIFSKNLWNSLMPVDSVGTLRKDPKHTLARSTRNSYATAEAKCLQSAKAK